MLRSERFRITTDDPPFSGIYLKDEIGSLIGSSLNTVGGLKPARSKDQLHQDQVTIDYSEAKMSHARALGMDNTAYRQKLLKRLN